MVKTSKSIAGFLFLILIIGGLSYASNHAASISRKCQKLGGVVVEPKTGPTLCLKPESIIEVK